MWIVFAGISPLVTYNKKIIDFSFHDGFGNEQNFSNKIVVV